MHTSEGEELLPREGTEVSSIERGRRAEWNESEWYGLSMGTDQKEVRVREEMVLPMSSTSSSAGMKTVERDPCRLPLPLVLVLPLLG
jgi:hypothetical protein